MSMQSFSLNANILEEINGHQAKKEKNICAKIARNFIYRIELNYNFKSAQIKKIVFALALALSATSESKICLKCLRRSLMGDKESCVEKVIVQKLINNLTVRGNFSDGQVKNIINELYKSIDYNKVIHSFELIQHMRTFVKTSATN